MATVSVTDENFDRSTEVLKSSKPIVVDLFGLSGVDRVNK